ncbi:MAG TPA: YkgJ family cysteine cluster protein [candidate division Zixibacteria bacterium]|nr:YkgJ family cysteine cluster protein [candidate division Zixibacteria bacterium]
MFEETKKFYEDGLRFTCRRCGECCRGIDAYVWLYRGDIEGMAEFLDMSETEFRAEFVDVFDGALVLKSFPDGDCIFLEDGACSIHEARPIQCKAFPFWVENVRSAHSWAIAGKQCPGVGSGELHCKEEIEAYIKQMGGL